MAHSVFYEYTALGDFKIQDMGEERVGLTV
jgi:hypothetical protein